MPITLGFSPSFIIDSKDRIQKTDSISSFHHRFNITSNSRYNRVALVSLRLPKSYYTAQTTHNNLSFVLDENGDFSTITLPEGNYHANSFMIVLSNLLTTNSPNGWIYTMTYPDTATQAQTFKFTFTVTENAGVQPIFILDEHSFRIQRFMGLTTELKAYEFSGDSLTSDICFMFQHTSYITLRSSMADSKDTVDSDSSILARIDVDENIPDMGTINYRAVNIEDSSRVFTNTSSNMYNFSLYDDTDRLLELTHDWSCVILIYEEDNSSQYIINDIKLRHIRSSQEDELNSTKVEPTKKKNK